MDVIEVYKVRLESSYSAIFPGSLMGTSQCEQVKLFLHFTSRFIKSLSGRITDWARYSGVKQLVGRSGLGNIAPSDLISIQSYLLK